jgi:hypothetical protein
MTTLHIAQTQNDTPFYASCMQLYVTRVPLVNRKHPLRAVISPTLTGLVYHPEETVHCDSFKFSHETSGSLHTFSTDDNN